MGEIPFDPDRIIRSGRHEYRIVNREFIANRWVERWLCRRCGQITDPSTTPFVDCEVPA